VPKAKAKAKAKAKGKAKSTKRKGSAGADDDDDDDDAQNQQPERRRRRRRSSNKAPKSFLKKSLQIINSIYYYIFVYVYIYIYIIHLSNIHLSNTSYGERRIERERARKTERGDKIDVYKLYKYILFSRDLLL
jgi:hypothetical protein